jgi:hypothetical protein
MPYQIKRERAIENTRGSIYFSSSSFKNNPNSWNDSLQQNYYQKPALLPTIPWLVQYEVASPSVIKQSENTYQINQNQGKKVKQIAILQGSEKHFTVAAIVSGETKFINLNALGLDKKNPQPYWIVAIGNQNQLSKLVALP